MAELPYSYINIFIESAKLPMDHPDTFLTEEDLSEMTAQMGHVELLAEAETCFQSNDTPKKRKRRLKFASDEILLKFRCRRNPMQCPKKEYVRCGLIRAHRKAIRQQTSKRPDDCSEIQQEYWKAFRLASQSLQTVELTRPGQASSAGYRSFSNSFCQSYFKSEAVRLSYALFIEYLFAHKELSTLCRLFHISCCSGLHSIACATQWSTFKTYSE